jgi:hypothetical protein
MDTRQDLRPADGWSRAAVLATAAAAAVAWLLAACSAEVPGAPGSHSPPPASPGSHASPEGPAGSHAAPAVGPARTRGGPIWLLTRSALSQVVTDPGAREALRASRVYEILQPGQPPLPGVAAERVVTFASAAALEQAVVDGQVPAGTYGVLYDPEAWSFTPPAEQRDPVQAAARAAVVAHAHGLRLIVAPALNLTTVLAPGRGPRWQAFLDLGLAGRMARVADVVELQAQSLERSTATYAAFVRAAAAQAAGVNPHVTVLAGLSTNPPGAPVGSQNLASAIQATRSLVAGYWLNIPGQGARCPTCNAPRPDIAVQTLRQLG